MSDGHSTLTRRGGTTPSKQAEGYLLYRILDGARPLDPGLRCSLHGLNRVDLGRAENPNLSRSGPALKVGLADGTVSSQHAALRRVLDRWSLVDLGSKNGTFLNGQPVQESVVADGDVIEIGRTFFLFRGPVSIADDDGDGWWSPENGPEGLITMVPPLQRSFEQLGKVAPSEVPVLVRGPSGTGKELIARAVHELSGRRGRLVAVNCGALPKTLIESELFGSKKGAFSGATEDRPGLIRTAHEGTLFLDEIGELSPAGQAALLRALQEREVLPVGATAPVPVAFRVVAATHRDLDALVSEETFRADLLARLSGFRLTLPSLHERREDLALLVAALLRRQGAADVTFSSEASRALALYDWPANTRELELCLAAATALAAGGEIELEHLPEALRAPRASTRAPTRPAQLSPEEEQRRQALIDLLVEHKGNLSAVARASGKARVQIQRWVKRYGLVPEDYR